MVERDVPPDIGRRMGGVSLLFAPLMLCGPPTNSTGSPWQKWHSRRTVERRGTEST